jgi:hypothetical protein
MSLVSCTCYLQMSADPKGNGTWMSYCARDGIGISENYEGNGFG